MIDIDDIRRANIRRLEAEFGGPAELAARIGMTPAQLINLRNGARDSKTGRPRGMRKETARRIEAGVGKPEGWLDLPEGAVLPQFTGPSAALHAAHQLRAKYQVDANTSQAPERKGRVPLISSVEAGNWSHAADLLQPGEGHEWIETGVTIQSHTFALRVEGDSMEPEFAPGTILIVEPEMDAYPGDFVIAKNGDQEATFKQLVRDGADLYLKPLNPRYPIKPLGHNRIIGVVREAVKRYR